MMTSEPEHVALMYVDLVQLGRVLNLPEGVRIVAAHIDHDRNAVGLKMEGDGLPEHCLRPRGGSRLYVLAPKFRTVNVGDDENPSEVAVFDGWDI